MPHRLQALVREVRGYSHQVLWAESVEGSQPSDSYMFNCDVRFSPTVRPWPSGMTADSGSSLKSLCTGSNGTSGERLRTAPVVGVGISWIIEFWRAQVRLSTDSALRTFLLYHDPAAPGLLLESIS